MLELPMNVTQKNENLFTIMDGLVSWLPDGVVALGEIAAYLRKKLEEKNYQQVLTPHMGRRELCFKADQRAYTFPVMEGEKVVEYQLRHSTAPYHAIIYAATKKSYRDLPYRLFEFATNYSQVRKEDLDGLRVTRGRTQVECLSFVTPEQVSAEIKSVIDLMVDAVQSLSPDLTIYARIGAGDLFNDLLQLFDNKQVDSCRAENGPLVSLEAKWGQGQKWSMGSLQIDYDLHDKLNLRYAGPENESYRPVLIRHTLLGSMEQVMGLYLSKPNTYT